MVLGLNNDSDEIIFNENGEEFTPVVCHYDASTLLTKNGHLLQTIHIHGLGAETISDELLNLRAVVRNAIKECITSDRFAFWIHTVRRKKNLDDDSPYPNEFSEKLHGIWRNKNFWHDKFVNSLYITVVYKKIELKPQGLRGFIDSMQDNKVFASQDQYFAESVKILSDHTDALVKSMEALGAKKLVMRLEKEGVFSELLHLYRRIVHLNEDKLYVEDSDFAESLSTHRYAVGSDKLEVIAGETRKFAALLSFREYQEFSSGSLDKFLQFPVEMIATEMFHFVSQEEAETPYKYQKDILAISGDKRLSEVKGVADLFSADTTYATAFCNQQISITLIADSAQKLDADIVSVSNELGRVGVVHVREDVNLEATFWSQLPGNFGMLRRVTPTNIEATCALASLHNFPTGLQDSVWGDAITLLRTEKGTPYFMNFHDESEIGHSCIFGHHATGKTVATNFFISEAFKKKPAVMYITTDNSSQLFVESMGGKWHDEPLGIDPLQLFKGRNQPAKFKGFLEILLSHIDFPESVDHHLQAFVDFIWQTEGGFIQACKQWSAPKDEAGKKMHEALQVLCADAMAEKLFTKDNTKSITYGASNITAVNLGSLTQQLFYNQNYSEEKKVKQAFPELIRAFDGMSSAYVYVLLNGFVDEADIEHDKKICVFENLHEFFTNSMFIEHLILLYKELTTKNGLIFSNINLNEFVDWSQNNMLVPIVEKELYDRWFDLQTTQIFLGADEHIAQLAEVAHLSKLELEKVTSFTLSTRLFVIKQSGLPITVELSLGGFVGLLRILSCEKRDLDQARVIQEKFGKETNQWLSELYNVLETVA